MMLYAAKAIRHLWVEFDTAGLAKIPKVSEFENRKQTKFLNSLRNRLSKYPA